MARIKGRIWRARLPNQIYQSDYASDGHTATVAMAQSASS